MKIKSLFLSILISVIAGNIFGQKIEKQVLDNNNVPKFIKFEKALSYSKNNEQEVFNKFLNVPANNTFKKIFTEIDELSEQILTYQQYYKGIKVEYGQYKIHSKKQKIKLINGNFVQIKNLSDKPAILPQAALQTALKTINAKKYIWELDRIEDWQNKKKENNVTLYPTGQLVVWSDINNKNVRLAYKFDIYSIEPLSRYDVFIDAHTGLFIEKESIMHNSGVTGTLKTRYSGSLTATTDSYSNHYRLYDPERGSGIHTYDMNTGTNFSNAVDFFDNDNNWTASEWHNTQKDDAALDAHWALQKTYDYFHSQHDRNSYDNKDAAINCYVHYKVNWENAAWDGSRILIGDGASNFDVLASIDVLAHEFGHAVCTHTCNLRYGAYESAALNEGLSDIWGICVENFSTSNKQTWLIGEDITIKSGYNCLRNIQNPKSTSALEGQHPDTYHGSYWDYGNEPHNNSTVLSHWFYLLAHGGSGINDLGHSFTIQGVGITKASQIVYRMETQYLSSNSTYSDAKTYAIQAAEDIFGTNSIEVYTTTNAWYAVGIGNQYYDIKITGSNLVCTSNSTFMLQNRPSNSSVSWTNSSNLTQIGGNTSTTYTVKADNSYVNGNGWVKANVSGVIFTKTFWVGEPSIPVMHFPFNTVGVNSYIETFAISPGASNYTWLISGGTLLSGQGTDNIALRTSSRCLNDLTIRLTSSNTCGNSVQAIKSIPFDCSGGPNPLKISPNPATSEAVITIQNNSKQISFNEREQWEIEIYNQNYILQEKQSKLMENSFKVNTSSWKEGIYYIKAIYKGEIISGKLIIKR